MSKFDYEPFYTDYGTIIVINKERYTKEKATEIAKYELEEDNLFFDLGNCYVRHRFGVTEDGEKRSTWWLEDILEENGITLDECECR